MLTLLAEGLANKEIAVLAYLDAPRLRVIAISGERPASAGQTVLEARMIGSG